MAENQYKQKGKGKVIDENQNKEKGKGIMVEEIGKGKDKLMVIEEVEEEEEIKEVVWEEKVGGPVIEEPWPSSTDFSDYEAFVEEAERLEVSMPDPKGKRPMVSDVVGYYSDANAVRHVLKILKGICTEEEINMIADICPQSVEEAYARIPSLKEKEEWIEDPLIAVLIGLAELRY